MRFGRDAKAGSAWAPECLQGHRGEFRGTGDEFKGTGVNSGAQGGTGDELNGAGVNSERIHKGYLLPDL
eukprot:2645595-Pyramimonas_sp.AAC.1